MVLTLLMPLVLLVLLTATFLLPFWLPLNFLFFCLLLELTLGIVDISNSIIITHKSIQLYQFIQIS